MFTKQSVPINFSQGLDTKTDPYQVQLGKFLSLENSIFTKAGLLQKRNGFGELASLPNLTFSYTTTFNGNLTAIGTQLAAYSQSSNDWITKGSIQPVQVNTLSLIRNNLNQIQCDAAISPNGLVCTVYTETGGATSPQYKYVVANSITGQNIVPPTVIASIGSPRVFVLGNYFVVVFSTLITSTFHLEYVAINYNVPTIITGVTDISSQYTPATTLSWDGIVANNSLYLAWAGSDIGGAIRMTYIDQTLVQHGTVVFSGHTATNMSVTADETGNTPVIWAAFYDGVSSTGYVLAVNQILSTILAPTEWVASVTVLNVASAAQNGSIDIFYEVQNDYGYDSSVPTNFTSSRTCTQGGTLGTAAVLLRSVGLASKAFVLNSTIYFMAVYSSAYQPTYFVSDALGNVITKLAYSNGGGYLTLGLPSVSVIGTTASVAYLYRDLIEPINKPATNNVNQNAPNSGLPVYAQTGITLGFVDITTTGLVTAEIGNDLHLSGGFLWMYDGYVPVEHNFFLWPDNIEITYIESPVTPTGTFSNGAVTGTLSSGTGVYIGMTISDTTNPSYITAGTVVTEISGTSVTISNATTHAISGDTLSIHGNIAAQPDTMTNTDAYYYVATYEWADNQGNIFRSAPSIPVSVTTASTGNTGTVIINVPTLRLTYKVANPVKIVLYRWSVENQVYYAIQAANVPPILNDKTIDYITFADVLPDADIIGNAILYTTGGVAEDIGAPATNIMALFDTRLWLVDAEDQNLLWYSKQVIEATPVEMSDLFTFYVAPTTAAQGNTGPITALGAMDDKLIIFKKDAIYYINGTGPDNTGANSQYNGPIFITSTVGCADPASIVFIPEGLMFQSDKGIWLLGRDLSTTYIGAPVEEFNQYEVLSALNIPGTNQVRFTLSNGVTLMYDYYYQQWGTFVNIPAISSVLYGGLHTFINKFGQLFQETPGLYLDGSNPVLLAFTTSWINLAGLQGYQRAHFFYLLGTYLSPHKLNVGIAYDYNSTPQQTDLISPNNFVPNWGGDSVWGQSSPWGGAGDLEQWRVFMTKQRCQSFQIILNEIYDPSFGLPAGEGLTLSGINLVLSIKRGWRTISAAQSVGSS